MATVDYTKPRTQANLNFATRAEESSLGESFGRVLRTAFTPTGRINRRRYIKYLTLLWLPVAVICYYLYTSDTLWTFFENESYVISFCFYLFITIITSLCLGVKRGHDMGRSSLLSLFEIIRTAIIPGLIVYSFTKGSVGSNQYGADPLQT